MSETSILKRLQNRHQERQKLYDLVSENIRCLEEAYHSEASSPLVKLQRKRELEEAEDERETIEQEMCRLEWQIAKLKICRIYNEFVRLDCLKHIKLFEEFVMRYRMGAFALHGHTKYGVRLLLKRILKELSFNTIPFSITLDIPSIQRLNSFQSVSSMDITDIDVDILWNALGRKVGLKRYALPAQIASRIAQKREQQPVLLILEVDITCDLTAIIHQFWSDLAKMVQEHAPDTGQVFLLLILLEDSEYLNKWGIKYVEVYKESWTPDFLVKLPIVDRYDAKEIEDWIAYTDILPFGCRGNIPKTVNDILGNTDNGFPDRVLKYICNHLCRCEFNEEVLDAWLKI